MLPLKHAGPPRKYDLEPPLPTDNPDSVVVCILIKFYCKCLKLKKHFLSKADTYFMFHLKYVPSAFLGSAHTVLGSYWSKILGKKKMLGEFL